MKILLDTGVSINTLDIHKGAGEPKLIKLKKKIEFNSIRRRKGVRREGCLHTQCRNPKQIRGE